MGHTSTSVRHRPHFISTTPARAKEPKATDSITNPADSRKAVYLSAERPKGSVPKSCPRDIKKLQEPQKRISKTHRRSSTPVPFASQPVSQNPQTRRSRPLKTPPNIHPFIPSFLPFFIDRSILYQRSIIGTRHAGHLSRGHLSRSHPGNEHVRIQ